MRTFTSLPLRDLETWIALDGCGLEWDRLPSSFNPDSLLCLGA